MAYPRPEEMPEFDYKNWQATEEQVRAPTNNKRRTKSLFHELIPSEIIKQYPAVYTLMEHAQWDAYHGVWLPSAKQIYLNSVDEYDAASKLVVSVEHWNRLVRLDWFLNGNDDWRWTSLSQWREELRDVQESWALRLLMKQAEDGNVAAIKSVLDKIKVTKRGRPSKAEVDGERKAQAREKSVFDQDHERILKIVGGNGKQK